MELQPPRSLAFMAGDTMHLRFTVVDEAGVAADISGMTAIFSCARTPSAEPALTTEGSSPSAVFTMVDAPAGVFDIQSQPADTEGLQHTYEFDCRLEDGAGDIQTVSHGYLTFELKLLS